MSIFSKKYDAIVVGGGLAGVHAAKEASRHGQVLLLAASLDRIAWLGWGPMMSMALIKELDERGAAFPRAAIRANVLSRVNTDGDQYLCVDPFGYQDTWKTALETAKRLTVYQDAVERIVPGADGWRVETVWGGSFEAHRAIVAVGTFLDSRVRIGDSMAEVGRPGETGARGLVGALTKLGVGLVAATKQSPPTVSAGTLDRAKLDRLSGTEGPEALYAAHLPDGRQVVLAPMDVGGRQLYLGGHVFDREAIAEKTLREAPGLRDMEVVTPGLQVDYERLAPGQLDKTGQHHRAHGLFFTGKIAGLNTYGESIVHGTMVGAARR